MARLGLFNTRIGTALIYIGSMSKNPHKATLKDVNCRISKAFFINANEKCEFYLNPILTSGRIIVEMSDSKKHTVLTLNNENRTGVIMVDKKSTYKVVFQFDNASGKFEFGWK